MLALDFLPFPGGSISPSKSESYWVADWLAITEENTDKHCFMLVNQSSLSHMVIIHGVEVEFVHVLFHPWVWYDELESLATSLLVVQ